MSATARTRRETGMMPRGRKPKHPYPRPTTQTWNLVGCPAIDPCPQKAAAHGPGGQGLPVVVAFWGGVQCSVCQQTKGPCQPPDPRILFPDTNGSAGLTGTLHDWQTEQGPTHRRQAQIQTGGLASTRRRQTESRGLRLTNSSLEEGNKKRRKNTSSLEKIS